MISSDGSDDEPGRARGDRSPLLSGRQWNGWAKFVVGVILPVEAVPGLARRHLRAFDVSSVYPDRLPRVGFEDSRAGRVCGNDNGNLLPSRSPAYDPRQDSKAV